MDRIVRICIFFCRLIFGLTFICSGALKMVDPVGTGLIVTEYLKVFHLQFLIPSSVGLGIALSVLEFVTGIGVLVRIRMQVVSWMALGMMLFFTVITFILYCFSPIEDCGCFGEAVHLTNAQTFFKNIVLLGLIIPVFLFRKKFRITAGPVTGWIYLGLHALAAVLISVYAYRTLPLKDFGDFREGTDISYRLLEDMTAAEMSGDLYVYEKDGVQREFSLSEIPDTTWSFVEVRQGENAYTSAHAFDFAVSTSDGAYITEQIVMQNEPVLLFVIYEPDDMEVEYLYDMAETASMLEARGARVYILMPGTESLDRLARRCDTVLAQDISVRAAFCDYKTLISLCRSNGGAVYLNEGLVVDKFPSSRTTYTGIMASVEKDPDECVADNSIRQKMLLELIIVITLVNIIFFRYICGLIRSARPVVENVRRVVDDHTEKIRGRISERMEHLKKK